MDGTGLTISLVVLSRPFLWPFKCKIKLDRTFVLYEHNEQPIGCENICDMGILCIVSGENNRPCFAFDFFSIIKFVFEHFFLLTSF